MKFAIDISYYPEANEEMISVNKWSLTRSAPFSLSPALSLSRSLCFPSSPAVRSSLHRDATVSSSRYSVLQPSTKHTHTHTHRVSIVRKALVVLQLLPFTLLSLLPNKKSCGYRSNTQRGSFFLSYFTDTHTRFSIMVVTFLWLVLFYIELLIHNKS